MKYDYTIVGAGIIGMTIAYQLKKKYPNTNIAIIEKENEVALHASGRNSGMLHAGFYYSADSLKAKLTVDGNKLMKEFCNTNDIFVNETKKIVVINDEMELQGLYELQKRAEINNVNTSIINEEEAKLIDPNMKTYKKALYSPTTVSVDSIEVCLKLKDILKSLDVKFYFNTKFEDIDMEYNYLINSTGAYADKIAQSFGLAQNYIMLPFKGIYLKYMEDKTAISAFWRENYKGFDNFNIKELIEILYFEAKLFIINSFNFRNLAISEMKNYFKSIFIQKAKSMVYKIGNNFQPIPAGIRSQLLNTTTNELVQDFVIEHSKNITHIANAVSPVFTCSFAFAKYVIKEINQNKEKHYE